MCAAVETHAPFSIVKTAQRKTISPDERLALTLRFLATGEMYRSLTYAWRLGLATISGVVAETRQVIYDVLAPTYLRMPDTPAQWRRVAAEFADRWNLPHALGISTALRQPCSLYT